MDIYEIETSLVDMWNEGASIDDLKDWLHACGADKVSVEFDSDRSSLVITYRTLHEVRA